MPATSPFGPTVVAMLPDTPGGLTIDAYLASRFEPATVGFAFDKGVFQEFAQSSPVVPIPWRYGAHVFTLRATDASGHTAAQTVALPERTRPADATIIHLQYDDQRLFLANTTSIPANLTDLQFAGNRTGQFAASRWQMGTFDLQALEASSCIQVAATRDGVEQNNIPCSFTRGWVVGDSSEQFWRAENTTFGVLQQGRVIAECRVASGQCDFEWLPSGVSPETGLSPGSDANTARLLSSGDTAASETALSVTRPDSRTAAANYRSIWSMVQFRDMQQPGTQSYEATINATEPIRLEFSWCATAASLRDNILAPLRVTFALDGQAIPGERLLTTDTSTCRYWVVILSGWRAGQDNVLEVNYQLTTPIFDGNATYDAGQYSQHILVHAL